MLAGDDGGDKDLATKCRAVSFRMYSSPAKIALSGYLLITRLLGVTVSSWRVAQYGP